MPAINFQNTQITLKPNQTALEGLLEAGFSIPNACRAGACQACKLQATQGTPPVAAQFGLSQAEQKLGFFLSCQCHPTQDLTLSSHTAATVKAKVLSVTLLTPQVLRVRLAPVFDFLAGQYFTFWHQPHPSQPALARSYSIASMPSEGYIECHIKYIAGGAFSPYAFRHLKPSSIARVQGPMGTCIYSPSQPTQPLLLAAIGTGLAPIYGIVKTAIAQGHTGPIHLVVGAKTPSGLYLQNELATLANEHRNIRVSYAVQTASNNTDIYQYCKSQHPSTKDFGIYLCGGQSFVSKLKKQCFLLGANRHDIHADAFIPCTSTP